MRKLLVSVIAIMCLWSKAATAVRLDDGINVTGTIAATGTCPTGAGTVTVATSGIATVGVNVAGTFSATLQFKGSIDGTNLIALTAIAATGESGVSSVTSTGQWFISSAGLKWVCVYGSSFVSGSATVVMEPSPAISASTFGANATPSTPTAYTSPGQVVAQRPTTVATAPTSVSLNGATAVKVFASTAGICQVTVCNEDASIKDTCGQTNAVTNNAIGLPVPAGSCYSTSQWYGGDVWCVSASGTPTVGVQSVSCP